MQWGLPSDGAVVKILETVDVGVVGGALEKPQRLCLSTLAPFSAHLITVAGVPSVHPW